MKDDKIKNKVNKNNSNIEYEINIEDERAELKARMEKDLIELESGEDGEPLFDPKDIKPFKM
jgi:hypothetical protein